MLRYCIFAGQVLLLLSCAGFSFAMGGVAERRGVIWWCLNYLIGTALVLAGWKSPTGSLILDGIYATGLLPLAMIYVGWSVGALTLLAAAAFSLEAFYLIQDLPVDGFYSLWNNIIAAGTGVVFLASGLSNWICCRRLRPTNSPAAEVTPVL